MDYVLHAGSTTVEITAAVAAGRDVIGRDGAHLESLVCPHCDLFVGDPDADDERTRAVSLQHNVNYCGQTYPILAHLRTRLDGYRDPILELYGTPSNGTLYQLTAVDKTDGKRKLYDLDSGTFWAGAYTDGSEL